ncbi:hypothetical protein HED60_19345 [Planctomycetales bacterium ZRK34]|nr:hypothetical protein HED60_19345 [Planctomycetales bacterium ZRK34]
MATDIKPHGTTISGGTSGAFAYVVALGEIAPEAGDIETTYYGISDNARTYIAGLLEGGTVDVMLKYEDTSLATWYGVLGGAVETFTVTIPDGATFEFDGFIKKAGAEFPDATDDDYIRQPATIKVTGKPTFTAS